LDRETGEIVEKTLKHEAGTVREFYAALPAPVLSGSKPPAPWDGFCSYSTNSADDALDGTRIALGARLRHQAFRVRRLRDRRTRGRTRRRVPLSDLDLTLEPREDHAAYIANWLDVLTADNRAIFAAASHAQRAADFINGLQPASAA